MQEDRKLTARTGLVLAVIAVATIARIATIPLLGHQTNFAPVGAIALFGGAYFASRLAGILVPLAALFISDMVINSIYLGSWSPFYEAFFWQYFAYAAIAGIGMLLRERVSAPAVLGASVFSSVMFFLITNFGVWASTNMYPKTFEGLFLCYTMAIPFFGGTFAGDVFFAALMFGSCEFMLRKPAVPVRTGPPRSVSA